MAKITLERLNSTEKVRFPSNTLTDYYDILRRLMEALVCVDGLKFKGDGAHFQTINYVCNTYSLPQKNKKFIQELREYRNRISYEGFNISEDFIINNSRFIEELIDRLLKIVDKRIS